MAYSFLFGGDTGETPESLKQRRELISRLIMGQEQPRNWGQGVGAVLTGLAAGIDRSRTNKAEGEGRKGATDAYNRIFSTITGGALSPPQRSAGNMPMPGAASEMAGSAPGGNQSYRDAIASIESAGSGDYNAVGPTHPKLGRALGRYQVMEANIGPWSQAALGREISADEFMANPQIQDQIFDHQFGQYVNQYGPEGAAQAWFGGPGGVGKLDRTDSLGTSIGDYGQRFMRATGAEVASLDPSAGMAPAAAAIEQQAPGSGYVDPMVSAPNYAPQQAAANLPPLPSRDVEPAPQVAPVQSQQAPQQMAQAMSGPSLEELMQLQGNPWLSDEQRGMVNTLIEQKLIERDPYRQLQMQQAQQGLEKGRLELDALRNPQPGYRTLTPEEKQALGLPASGAFQIDQEGKIGQIGGGGVTINNEGNIPAGYRATRDPEGRVLSIEPIPGSPEAVKLEQAQQAQSRQSGARETSGSTITTAAQRAREAFTAPGILPTEGTLGAIASNLTESNAAEVRRQVHAIKSSASIETLNAMRQQSPTGGALGSVTEKENEMLAAKAGVLDPSSPNFLRDLDDYERTLLETIHGPEVGRAIFNQMRKKPPVESDGYTIEEVE